jgi:lysophospholipase L1-like esterase
MYQLLNKAFFLAVFTLAAGLCRSQDSLAPFYNEIRQFQSADSISRPPRHAILFIGSSSFTKWVDVRDYFPGYTIVNRGFGGSSLPDVIRYANEIVFPYHPKQVVIYCGENDIAGSDTISPLTVFNRFRQLFHLIRSRLPGVPIAFVSMKPSPSRKKYWPKMVQANAMVKRFLAGKPATAYIDVYHRMFNKDGSVMSDIFVEDALHMNAKGYAIWKKAIQPYLVK